jgi:hypothetical protein
MTSPSRWRIWATPLIAAVSLAMIPYGTTAVSPDAPGPSAVSNAWGWLVARQPSTFAYVPAPRDQGNSGGYGDRVERAQLGNYHVFFDRIGNGFYPIGMVTALSAGARSCMIDDNFGNDVGGDPSLEIDCFDKDGQPADARFVANIVLGGDGPTGTLGWPRRPARQPDARCSRSCGTTATNSSASAAVMSQGSSWTPTSWSSSRTGWD